jgi:hypothetical protein
MNWGRSSLLGRSIDYLSLYGSIWRCLVQTAGHDDLIIVKTDPPLLGVIAGGAARRKGARLINWLQDLYPELAEMLGVPFIRGPMAARFSSCAIARSAPPP